MTATSTSGVPAWKPTRAVEIVAGTARGGGLDRAARALALALEATRRLEVAVTVTNVPGDGARKAWAYMDARAADPHVLSVSHPNLTTDRLVGLAAFDHRDYTPVAVLYNEYIAFAARARSRPDDAAALLESAREGAADLTVALSTALGNPNHIALAKIVSHAGGDPRAPAVRVFDSALDALADVVAGNAEIAAVTAASTIPALAAGEVQLIAVSAPQRLAGPLAAMPTWRELGVDCVVGAWRGISLATDVDAQHVDFWTDALEAATATQVWRDELERNAWTPCLITGERLRRHLDEERADMAATLGELGLLLPGADTKKRKTNECNL